MLDLYQAASVTGAMTKACPLPDFKLSSTQIGKIAENLVAAQLMMVSRGRLSPFGSLADDDGTDLVIADKHSGRLVRIQVKCRQADRKNPPGTIQFDVRRQTFRCMADNYILYVVLDPNDGLLWRAWLIPATGLESVASARKDKLVITPNPSMASADRFSGWRCEGLADVARVLVGGAFSQACK